MGTGVSTTLKVVQSEICILCDFISKKRRNFNVQASCLVLTIRLSRFDVMFPQISQMNPFSPIINNFCMEGNTKQLLGNARTSLILIVAKESQQKLNAYCLIYPSSQCIDMGQSCFFCEPQREKSKNTIRDGGSKTSRNI